MQKNIYTLILLFVLFSPLLLNAQSLEVNRNVVAPDLIEQMEAAPQEMHSIVLILKDQLDVLGMAQTMEKNKVSLHDRRVRIIQSLEKKAQLTQAPLVEKMSKIKGIEKGSIREYWIANLLEVNANLEAVIALSQLDVLEAIEAMPVPKLLEEEEGTYSPPIPNGSEVGLRAINADKMWALGYTGYGTKVVVIDSGQDFEHPTLKTNFWGNNVPVSQAWAGSEAPEDCDYHGTSVMGVVNGIDRVTNDTIGVAPNSKWLGAPFNPSNANCTLSQNVRFGFGNLQWALNPDGSSNTTNDIPDVMNNSWGGDESCGTVYRDILNTLEAAGIAVIWSAGNLGPNTRTITSPSGLNTSLVNTFAVGSVNFTDIISDFSSRGPSSCSGTGSLAIKPEVVAPGEQIRTASKEEGYTLIDGTSFSAPHVAGAILLLKEAFPEASGSELKLALYRTARDLGVEGEDNVFGTGMIDVFAAYQYLLDQGFTATPPISTDNDIVLVDVQTRRSTFCKQDIEIDIVFENSGSSVLRSMEADYFLTGATSRVQRLEWEGSLAYDNTTTFTFPALQNLPVGSYELIVDIFSPNGRTDQRNQNNRVRHSFEILDLLPVEGLVANAYEDAICGDAEVVLESKSALEDNQIIHWYDAEEGGELIGVGSKALTPALSESTTFYADIITQNSVGKKAAEEGDDFSYFVDDGGLTFDALQPFILKTVKVYAEERGGRIIKLLTSQGDLIKQKVINIPVGESVLELNFDIPIGENYELVVSTGKPLLHLNSGADYPYEIDGVVSIKRSASPATTFHYFYFFDWQIESNHACGRTAVDVNISSTSRVDPVFFSASTDSVFLSNGGTINFTNETDNFSSLNWDFGDGTTSTIANPTHTYTTEGTYKVILTVVTSDGCVNSTAQNIVVADRVMTSTNTIEKDYGFIIYPNPTNDLLTIELENGRLGQLQLVDMLGRSVGQFDALINDKKTQIDLSDLASGIYYLWMTVDGKMLVEKVVKE